MVLLTEHQPHPKKHLKGKKRIHATSAARTSWVKHMLTAGRGAGQKGFIPAHPAAVNASLVPRELQAVRWRSPSGNRRP